MSYRPLQPSIKPFPDGAYSPRTAAIAINNDNIARQTALLNVTRGGGGNILVPSVPTMYPTVGSNGQTMSGNILAATKLGAQLSANGMYDGCVGQGSACTQTALDNYMRGGVRRKRLRRRSTKRRRVKRKSSNKRRRSHTKKQGGALVRWGCMSG